MRNATELRRYMKNNKNNKMIGIIIVGTNEILFGLYIFLSVLLYMNEIFKNQTPSTGAGLSLIPSALFCLFALFIIRIGFLVLKYKPKGRTLSLFAFPIFMIFTGVYFCDLTERFLPSQIADLVFYIYYLIFLSFPIYYLNRQKVKEKYNNI